MKFCLGMDDKPAESLWVRIKEKTCRGDFVVGANSRLPGQKKQVDEALYTTDRSIPYLQALALIGDFSQPNICQTNNTEGISSPGDSWSVSMTTFSLK